MNKRFKVRVWDKEKRRFLDWFSLETDSDGLQLKWIKSWDPTLTEEEDIYGIVCLSATERFSIIQWTGLKDKNGVDIYEGNILLYAENTGVVEYGAVGEQICFYIHDTHHGSNAEAIKSLFKISTIIGNIYENPELLEEKVL